MWHTLSTLLLQLDFMSAYSSLLLLFSLDFLMTKNLLILSSNDLWPKAPEGVRTCGDTQTHTKALGSLITAFKLNSPECSDAHQCQRLAQSCLPRGRFLSALHINSKWGEVRGWGVGWRLEQSYFTPSDLALVCAAWHRGRKASNFIPWWHIVSYWQSHTGAKSPAASGPVHSTPVSHRQRCHSKSIAFVSLLEAPKNSTIVYLCISYICITQSFLWSRPSHCLQAHHV